MDEGICQAYIGPLQESPPLPLSFSLANLFGEEESGVTEPDPVGLNLGPRLQTLTLAMYVQKWLS